MNIIQVVRRFGRVGGMESYVWQLSSELLKLGHTVTVICEKSLDVVPEGIHIVEVGAVALKPRWVALYRFSLKAHQLLKRNEYQGAVVHSHERLGVHHITTFHGPPFASIRARPLWKRLSPRIWAHLYLEKRELLSKTVQVVVPNSCFIAGQLASYYPLVSGRLSVPVPPGVGVIPKRQPRTVNATGGIIGFVGKEWRRKGLECVLQILRRLALIRPNIELRILGPDYEEIHPLVSSCGFKVEVLGWKDATTYYQDMDLLIHPAKREPYGMVIAEAMASGVPVLVSDVCGVASEIPESSGRVLSLELSFNDWTKAAHELLSLSPKPTYVRTWSDVASSYEKIYRNIDISN